MHPDQAQNTLSGIQGQEATAVAVIYVTAPTSSRKTTKYKCTHSKQSVHTFKATQKQFESCTKTETKVATKRCQCKNFQGVK